jgi:hypothetical protein
MLKTKEIIIKDYITNQICNGEAFSKSQHGFTKNSSFESAIHAMLSFVEKGFAGAFNYRQKNLISQSYNGTLAVFIDIRRAFDNVTHEAVVDVLKKKKLKNGSQTGLKKT